MALINQPFDGQLGDLLIEKLQEQYRHLTILVAFAKNSGVLRIKPALERFRENGGIIDVFVGVDIQGTSYEALQNLIQLCDSLYVVHSENSVTTFHSKVYLLENDNNVWIAVGSNNLTGGGLWTNFESCHCESYTKGTPECDSQITPLVALVDRYRNVEFECSRRIETQNDIDELEQAGYLIREARMRINLAENRQKRTHNTERPALFGHHRGIGQPRLRVAEPDAAVRITTGVAGVAVQATHIIETTDTSERIWFEARALTGGSRNILDLSKLGRVISGSAAGSRYETNDPRFVLGGVAFFDIAPEDTETVKDITVNYAGVDYYRCTIKYPVGDSANGTWRIQLKGVNVHGQKIHTVVGNEWLVGKILIFEKIRSDYYSLSVLEPTEIQACRDISYVVAHNGSRHDAKEYGLMEQQADDA